MNCRLRQATIENVGKMSQWSRQESVKIVGWIPPRIWSLICLATIPYLVTLYQLPRGFRFHRSSPNTYIQRRPSTKLSISTLCQAECYLLHSSFWYTQSTEVCRIWSVWHFLRQTSGNYDRYPSKSNEILTGIPPFIWKPTTDYNKDPPYISPSLLEILPRILAPTTRVLSICV